MLILCLSKEIIDLYLADMAGHHGRQKIFLVGGRPYQRYFLEGVIFLEYTMGLYVFGNVQIAFLHSRKGALPLVLHSQV